jgi:adenylate cyclase
MSFGAGAYAALGDVDRAHEWAERGALVDPDNSGMRYNFACALAAFGGDKEGALRQLDRSLRTAGAFHVMMAETDPDLDSLHEEPQFKAIMTRARKRLGIKEPIEAI